MNSDDYFSDVDAVKYTIEKLEKENADYSFATAKIIDGAGKELYVLKPNIYGVFSKMPFCHQTMFTKTEVLKKEGMFDLAFKSAADYDLVIRLVLKKYKFAEIKQNIVTYRATGESVINIEKSRQLYIGEDMSKKKSVKAESYFDKFIDAVEKIDSSLEEKFNDTLKRFSFVKEELAPKIIKEEACLPIANYGKEFSDMRNAIGHGFPPEIENKHVVLFRITRVLIYTLILSECGFTENKIRTMLIKLKM